MVPIKFFSKNLLLVLSTENFPYCTLLHLPPYLRLLVSKVKLYGSLLYQLTTVLTPFACTFVTCNVSDQAQFNSGLY